MGEAVLSSSGSQNAIQERILHAAATLLAEHRYDTVDLAQIATSAGLQFEQLHEHYPTMHAIGTAILTAEGSSMRAAMAQAQQRGGTPIEVLEHTFELIGANMASRAEVRAGMRIAAESRQFFPERKIDPYRTWYAFVSSQLQAAESAGLLRAGTDLDAISWLIVSAGMGTKDLVAFREAWDEIAERLNTTLSSILRLITV